MEETNPNNVGILGAQTYIASSSLIKQGSNTVASINLLTLGDGSLRTETVSLLDDPKPNKLSEPKFSVPNDQLIIDAIKQLEIDNGVQVDTYTIESTQYFDIPNTIMKEFIIKGKIIDFYKNKPLPNVNVILPLPGTKFNSKTNSQGEFKIKAVYPINRDTEKVSVRPPILVTAKGYIPKKLTPYALDQTVREDLSTISLKSTQGLTAEAKADIARVKRITILIIQQLKPKKNSLKILLKKFISILKERLIPYALSLLAPFLIGKAIDMLMGKLTAEEAQGPCPSPEKIEEIKAKRNKMTRQLNSIYNIVNTALIAVGILGGLAAIIKIAAQVLRSIPLPTAVPPGIGFPTSLILGFQRLIDKLLVYAEKVFTFSLGISAALLVLSNLLLQVIKLLGLLDQQLLRCSVDSSELEELSFNIEDGASDDVSNENNNLVNGFVLGVIVDDQNPVGNLRRRFATATDSRGVVVLKGEPSFSASEQVLKDELAFYIRANNLKAN